MIDAVGGPAGRASFETAQQITRRGGRLMHVSMYHEEPLSIDSHFLMSRALIGANYDQPRWGPEAPLLDEVLTHLNAELHIDRMISHRLPYTEAPEAFELLYHRPQEAMGVVLQ